MSTKTIDGLLASLRDVEAAWARGEIEDGYGAEDAAILAADPQAWILIDPDDVASDRGPTMRSGYDVYGRLTDGWDERSGRQFLVKLGGESWRIDAAQSSVERYEYAPAPVEW